MKRTSKFGRFFKYFWFRYNPPNMAWDKMLNLLIDKGAVTKINESFIVFDDRYRVWIQNHPFSSGSLFNSKDLYDLDNENFHCTNDTKIKLEDFYHISIGEKLNEKYKVLNKDIQRYESK